MFQSFSNLPVELFRWNFFPIYSLQKQQKILIYCRGDESSSNIASQFILSPLQFDFYTYLYFCGNQESPMIFYPYGP